MPCILSDYVYRACRDMDSHSIVFLIIAAGLTGLLALLNINSLFSQPGKTLLVCVLLGMFGAMLTIFVAGLP
jgi:hypothetical protein